MKAVFLAVLFPFLFLGQAFAQNIRWDSTASTTVGVGTLVPILAMPGSSIAFFNACTSDPCSPTRATTYTSANVTTACPSGAQVVWQLPYDQACTSFADSRGNFGAYFQPGAYEYTVTHGGLTYGPFQFNVGGGGGGSFPLVLSPFNLDFYVAGSPSVCIGGTTKLDCAWLAANTWSNANLANAIIHLSPGVNTTNNGLSAIGNYAPSILGDATFGSLIRQTATISAPVVKYGCNVFASSVTLKDFQIDADFNAPADLYLGKAQEYDIEGVTLVGANGTGSTSNFAQIGDSSCGGGGGATFEGLFNHLTVSGRGTGASSWAVTSCSQSGGTPSCSISNGGTYHWNASAAYLVGYQDGTSKQPCSTMGTVTPTFTQNGTWTWGQTFYSQTLPTYTMSGVSLSGFSGCSGSLYLFSPDVPSPAYGVYAPFATDSVFNMLVVAGAGQTAGVANQNTANVFNGLHVYNNHVGYQAKGGGGHIYGYDCDSNLIMMQVTGASPLQESGCNVFYPSASLNVFNGAIMADLGGDTNHQSTFTQNTVVGGQGATPTDWHAFLQSDGPTDQNGDWPGSLGESQSPTVNPAGNFRHNPSTNATNDVVGPEVPATSGANAISPSRLTCENLWSGTASQQNCWAFQVTGSTSGVPTQEIFNVIPPSNALAPVSGRFWLFQTPVAATSGGNVNSITIGVRGSYWNGSAATNLGWNFITSVGAGTTPTSTLQINTSACPGTCTISTNQDFNSTLGYKIAGGAPSGHYPRGNGTDYVDGAIQQGDLPNTSPQVGTPTVGHATCVKTAGPPVVIGFCSTQPDASGLCTCN